MASGSFDVSLSNLALGFVAGALAVVTAHEATVYLLWAAKILPPTAQPWSLAAYGPFGVPRLVNGMFWGGLLGGVFAAIWPKLPGSAMWVRGLIYGPIVVVCSNWLLVPLIKGTVFGMPNQALFGGFDPKRMVATLIILTAFALALGIFYGLLKRRD